MNKIFTFLFFCICLNLSAQQWVQKTSLPSVHTGHAPIYFSLNDKLYVGGGYNANSPWGNYTDSLFEYTPSSDTWRAVANIPNKLQAASCFAINGKGYVVCGANSNYTNSVYEYDPTIGTVGTWTQKGTFPGTMRMNGEGFEFNGKGYVFGGFQGATTNEMYEYDAGSNTWTQLNPCPGTGRNEPFALVINNQIFVGMGANDDGSTYYNDIYLFDPNTVSGTMRGTYTALNPAPENRYAAASFAIGGTGYVGLGTGIAVGNTTRDTYEDFWKYDPIADTWTQTDNFNGGKRSHTFAEVVGGLPYVGCGSRLATSGTSFSPQLTDNWTWDISPCTTTVNLGRDTTLCTGNIIVLSDTNTNAIFLWSTGASGSSITITESGTYWLEVTKNGCAVRDSININFISPLSGVAHDTIICTGDVITFGIESPFATYQWNTNTTSPTISAANAGTYTQTVTNACGTAINTFNITEKECVCQLVFPTAFSPNGDGNNDSWRAIYLCPLTKFQLHVYNRWGEMVFSSNDVNERWDGTYKGASQPSESYVYFCQYTDPYTREQISLSGNLTLLR